MELVWRQEGGVSPYSRVRGPEARMWGSPSRCCLLATLTSSWGPRSLSQFSHWIVSRPVSPQALGRFAPGRYFTHCLLCCLPLPALRYVPQFQIIFLRTCLSSCPSLYLIQTTGRWADSKVPAKWILYKLPERLLGEITSIRNNQLWFVLRNTLFRGVPVVGPKFSC